MRVLFASLALICAGLLLASGTNSAGEKDKPKEVVLKGKITCAKCDLGVAKECATVIVVKGDKKDITYWFDAKGHKEHHDAVCTEAKKGSVTGTVKEADKKNVVTVKKVEFAK